MVSLIFIILFVIYVNKRDTNRLGQLISPTVCFVLPTIIVAIVYDFIGPLLGFYSLNRSIYSEILFSALFFVAGGEIVCNVCNVCNVRMSSLKNKQYGQRILNLKNALLKSKFYIIAIFVVALLALRIYSLGGLNVLISQDLQSQYGSSGLFGHLMIFSIFSIIVLLSLHFSDSHKILSYLLLLASFICVMFYQVKSWLIFPIIVSVLYKRCVGIKQSYWKYLVAIIAIVISFILGYVFTFSLSDTENQIFIVNHFLKYVFAGVGGWSEAISGGYPVGQNPAYLLQPFSYFLGIEQAVADSRYGYVLINDNGEYTNVFTLIGGTILFAGRFWAYVYFFILGVFSYFLACKCINRINTGYLLAYSVLCTSLFLGFFGSYFTLLNVYELMFYSFVIQYFIRLNKYLPDSTNVVK